MTNFFYQIKGLAHITYDHSNTCYADRLSLKISNSLIIIKIHIFLIELTVQNWNQL